MGRLVLLALVGSAGAGAAILPSLGSAQGTMASFAALDNGSVFALPTWSANGGATNAVSIAPGGTVSFSYPSGTSVHNAVFDGPQPSACTQTAAGPGFEIKAAPPLPYAPEGSGWSGSCRFDTPGTYAFHDGNRGPAMSGTISVGRTTTVDPPRTTTTPHPATGPTTMTYPVQPFPPAASALRAASPQRGRAVRGEIQVTTSSSRLVAELLRGHPAVRVGRTTIHGVSHGRKRFVVRLYSGPSRTLGQRRSLRLTLRVQVLGGGLGPTTLSRHVTLDA